MDLFHQDEIQSIVNYYGHSSVIVKWFVEEYSDKLLGYLGDHFRLNIVLNSKGIEKKLKLFVKSLPRNENWKAKYIKELNFFAKECVMLSKLFKNFQDGEEIKKWRPKLLYMREDLFVLEDVTEIGYVMPCSSSTMNYEELCAVVRTLARFHAQSFMYEERKSKELNRAYRIWEEYSEYLTDPKHGQAWRDTGEKAVIDFLKVYSKYKTQTDFTKYVEVVVPMLFDCASKLMRPSSEYRNVVVHRDLWTNNIFFKRLQNGQCHAIIIDFQTVVYCPPMIDLSSLIYFNTSRSLRDSKTDELVDLYYSVLSDELKCEGIDIIDIANKQTFMKSYQQSIVFGLTQAALLVPIIAMSDELKKENFDNPEKWEKMNVVSRSEEFINLAKVNENYRNRVMDILDEISDRYMFIST